MKLSNYHSIVTGTLLLTSALALQAQGLPTQPQTVISGPDLYLQVQGGAVYMQDLQVNVGSHDELKFNIGARAGLVLGYKFSKHWSTELDCGVIWNGFDTYGGYSFSGDKQADLYQIPVMVNYLYRLPIGRKFEGYLGVGLGGVVTIFHLNDNVVGFGDFQDSDVAFGGQGMAGFNYHLSRQVDLSLAYKFLGTTSHKWSDGGYYTQTDGALSHSLVLGVSMKY